MSNETLEVRFKLVLSLLEEHNNSVADQIPPEEFIANIKAMGGTSLERLKKFSHEEILECMPNLKIKPKILAKEIAGIFRGNEKAEKPESKQFVSAPRAERMSMRELLEVFDPEDYENSVAKRLDQISKKQGFLIYNNLNSVNVDASLALLDELKKGYSPREFYSVDGTPQKVYKIGEFPALLVDENPIYHNRPLRPDGTCDQVGRSWDGIPLKTRQLVYLIRDHYFNKAISLHEVNDLMDLALEGFDRLKERYQAVYTKFSELEKNNTLPRLKVELKKSSSTKKDQSISLSQGSKVKMSSLQYNGNPYPVFYGYNITS